MPSHGSGRVIQNNQGHIRLIINSIYYSRDCRRKEGGITYKGKATGIRFNMVHSLGNSQPGSHAKACIHHIKGHGISHGITANISCKQCLFPLHSLLYSVERGTMRTAGAKDWRANWKLWHFCHVSLSKSRILRRLDTQKLCQISHNRIKGIFPGIFYIQCQLSIYLHRQLIFSRYIDKLPLNHWIQFLYTYHLIEARQKLYSQFLWERMGRRNL